MRKTICGFCMLSLLFISGCTPEQNHRHQGNNADFLNDTTPFTVIISSVVSDRKLKITLPRCHFGKPREGVVNGSETKGIMLFFPMATFSNNENGTYPCPVKNEPYAKITIDALFPYPGEKELQFGNYWQKTNDRGAGVIEQNNDIQVYLTSPQRLSVFTNQSKQSLEDYKLTFVQDPKTSGYFADQIDVYSVFHQQFSIQYTIYSSEIIHKPGLLKFRTDPWFADKLIEIYSNHDSISNHPEVLAAFTQNNNRIVEYFYQHSAIIQGE